MIITGAIVSSPQPYRVYGETIRDRGAWEEVWTPDDATLALRRQVSRRTQIVRQRTRLKNEIHAVLAAHLIAPCPASDLFGKKGRKWLADQPLPLDERIGVEQRLRTLDLLAHDAKQIEEMLARAALAQPQVARLMTITGVNALIAISLGHGPGMTKACDQRRPLFF